MDVRVERRALLLGVGLGTAAALVLLSTAWAAAPASVPDVFLPAFFLWVLMPFLALWVVRKVRRRE